MSSASFERIIGETHMRGIAISNEAGLNKLVAAISISLGALSGANFMVSSHGVMRLFNERKKSWRTDW